GVCHDGSRSGLALRQPGRTLPLSWVVTAKFPGGISARHGTLVLLLWNLWRGLSSAEEGQQGPGPLKDGLEHFLGKNAGVGVLPAGMVAGQQGEALALGS